VLLKCNRTLVIQQTISISNTRVNLDRFFALNVRLCFFPCLEYGRIIKAEVANFWCRLLHNEYHRAEYFETS